MHRSKMVSAWVAENVLKKANAHAPNPNADISPKSVRSNEVNPRRELAVLQAPPCRSRETRCSESYLISMFLI
jgi:hypothetical protein